MELYSIRLQNFLCYYGDKNEFKFTPGLNLILGANGYGKSKLYDAFNWVFFDGISNQKGERINTRILGSNLISRKAIEETSGGKIECKVIIELKGKNKAFQIERKYFVEKSAEKIKEADGSTVKIFLKDELQNIPQEIGDGEFLDFIKNEIVPTDILDHIWFQGERGITKAIDTSSGQTLHNIINKISYIDMWKRYVDIAESALNRVNTSFKKEVNKFDKKKKEREKLEGEIQKLKDSLDANNKELSTDVTPKIRATS